MIKLRTSERATFARCQQRWWWGYRQGLVPNGPPAAALWFGGLMHVCLADYYIPGRKRGPHPAETWDKLYQEERRTIKTYIDGDKVFQDAYELGLVMLEGYVEHYGPEDHIEIIQPEWTAAMRVGKGITYLFTCDGVAIDHSMNGMIVILEHKTAAAISTYYLTMDTQAGSYLPFMTAKLWDEGILPKNKKIEIIRYNFLRKDVPKEDKRRRNADGLRLNKDGTVSKRQSVQAPLFVRHDVERNQYEREQQLQRIKDEVEHMNAIRDGRLPILKNTKKGCAGGDGESRCPFFDICELHEQGGDWETLRNATMHVEDPYGPYIGKVA